MYDHEIHDVIYAIKSYMYDFQINGLNKSYYVNFLSILKLFVTTVNYIHSSNKPSL